MLGRSTAKDRRQWAEACAELGDGISGLEVTFSMAASYPIPEKQKQSGRISAQGSLHLRNPNLGPNSGKRILDAQISDPNSWVEIFDLFFPAKEAPRKFTLEKFTSQSSLSKIQPRNRAQKIHIAPLQGRLAEKELNFRLLRLAIVLETTVDRACFVLCSATCFEH